jgi:hypothetical protein
MSKLTRIITIAAAAAVPAVLPAVLPGAAAAAPSAPAGFTLKTFATAPKNAAGPDDITSLGGHAFVGWQNGVGTKGEPGPTGQTYSTLVEYSRSGKAIKTWQLTGKVDGLGADSATNQVIATVNEDGNSSLYTIQLSGRHGGGVRHYRYSPAPDAKSTGGMFTGGGSDAVSVYDGQIILSASNPGAKNATAAFRAVLNRRTGVARLYPTFADDARATDAVTGKKVTLALTDPDSNAVVPGSSPRFGGDFALVSQADQEVIFTHGGSGKLERLAMTHGGTSAGVDDIRWADHSGGTLYIVDSGTNTIYTLRGKLHAGEVFAGLDTVGTAADTTELDTLNLATGELTPLVTGFKTVKGLSWAR